MTTKLSGPMLVPPADSARHLIVLLHGYGSDGNDLIAIGKYWSTSFPDTLFVAPNAPEPCDINPAGYQWFPIDTTRMISRAAGAEAARETLLAFLRDVWEQSGLTPGQTVLVGFSQGAMMALHVGLALETPLAGIVSFSGALIPPAGLVEGMLPQVPVCVLHGDVDTVVDPKLSQEAVETLSALGYEVSYHRSPTTGHGISEDMLGFAQAFVRARFA